MRGACHPFWWYHQGTQETLFDVFYIMMSFWHSVYFLRRQQPPFLFSNLFLHITLSYLNLVVLNLSENATLRQGEQDCVVKIPYQQSLKHYGGADEIRDPVSDFDGYQEPAKSAK